MGEALAMVDRYIKSVRFEDSLMRSYQPTV